MIKRLSIKKDKRLLVRAVVAFGLFLVATIGFARLANEIPEGDTLPLDDAILRYIHQYASPSLDTFFVAYTHLGGVVFITLAATLLGVILLYKKYKYKSFLVLTSVGGAALINFILKSIFERTRPDLWARLVTETSFSFPSGHAMVSSALALSIVIILWKTKWRIGVIICAAVYVLSIGMSRLYLGVHYPTDIIGGWIMGGIWVMIVTGLIALRINRINTKNT